MEFFSEVERQPSARLGRLRLSAEVVRGRHARYSRSVSWRSVEIPLQHEAVLSRRRRRFVIDMLCTSRFSVAWPPGSSSAVSLHASPLSPLQSARQVPFPCQGSVCTLPRRIREMAANGSLPATALGRQARIRRRITLRSSIFHTVVPTHSTGFGLSRRRASSPEAILVPNPPINGMLRLGSRDCRITGGECVFAHSHR